MSLLKLHRALSLINRAKKLCNEFEGKRDFLEITDEPFSDLATFIGDSIELNKKRERLTTAQVEEIIKRIDKGETYASIASDYDRGIGTIIGIARGKSYMNVPRPNGICKKRKRGRICKVA